MKKILRLQLSIAKINLQETLAFCESEGIMLPKKRGKEAIWAKGERILLLWLVAACG